MKAEAEDDPLRRGEWEASVPSIVPDLDQPFPNANPLAKPNIAVATIATNVSPE